MVAADDRPKRPEGFFLHVTGAKVPELWANMRRFDFETRPFGKTAYGNSGTGELKLDFSKDA